MAPSSNGPLKVALTVVFILSLTFLPPMSVGMPELVSGGSGGESKMVLGSKPPDCVNKCFNCKPCLATLVIPSDQGESFTAVSGGEGDGDDRYYLLLWKCKCGDKLFQP